MKSPCDERFLAEAKRFELRLRCDDCAHFCDDLGTCVHGYPTAEHRGPLDAPFVVFCKEFELA